MCFKGQGSRVKSQRSRIKSQKLNMKSVPLSKVQHGIYAECVVHQGELCYNLPYLFVLDGSLDESKLKSAVEKAVAAHPTLFTRIEVSAEGDPMQVVEQEAFTLNVEHGVMNIEEGTFNGEPVYDDIHQRFDRCAQGLSVGATQHGGILSRARARA